MARMVMLQYVTEVSEPFQLVEAALRTLMVVNKSYFLPFFWESAHCTVCKAH